MYATLHHVLTRSHLHHSGMNLNRIKKCNLLIHSDPVVLSSFPIRTSSRLISCAIVIIDLTFSFFSCANIVGKHSRSSVAHYNNVWSLHISPIKVLSSSSSLTVSFSRFHLFRIVNLSTSPLRYCHLHTRTSFAISPFLCEIPITIYGHERY